MRIVHFTNTYLPHVGGVANSVSSIASWLVKQGHEVLVVAPEFEGQNGSGDEAPEGVPVARVKAIRDFNKSGFSWRIPGTGEIPDRIRDFRPEIFHSHHPFLLGDTAVRLAYQHERPVIFTHHTRYEQYTHYLMKPNDALQRLATELCSRYERLCDGIVAPSESIRDLIREQGVENRIEVVPTGIDPQKYANGDRDAGRKAHGIPPDALVAGHVGRLAQEKNLQYLAEAGAEFLRWHEDAWLLMVGDGTAVEDMHKIFARERVEDRVIMPGKLTGQEVVNAYHAMDVFLFASHSETQGMVLAEAMTAGKPVIALDAPGAREVVHDGDNGLLLPGDAIAGEFARAVGHYFEMEKEQRTSMQECARKSSNDFSEEVCMQRLLSFYEAIAGDREGAPSRTGMDRWEEFVNRAEVEWDLLTQKTMAAWRAVFED